VATQVTSDKGNMTKDEIDKTIQIMIA